MTERYIPEKRLLPDAKPGDIFLSSDEIHQRLQTLASQIDKDYTGKRLAVVGIFDSAFMLVSDLARKLHSNAPLDILSMHTQTIGEKGPVIIKPGLKVLGDVSGKDALVVDVVSYTGRTLAVAKDTLKAHGATSVKTLALLSKSEQDVHTYTGYKIPEEVVVYGYGVDKDGKERNKPDIHMLITV